jgi:hypothetical protein
VAERKCAGCGNQVPGDKGVELWNSWFCSPCFISHSARMHKELTPDQIVALRMMGQELAGFLPANVVEMVAIGFYRRATGRADWPPADELERFVGEIQRLVVFSTSRKIMNLLTTWKGTFDEFVDQQENEVRDEVKRVADL